VPKADDKKNVLKVSFFKQLIMVKMGGCGRIFRGKMDFCGGEGEWPMTDFRASRLGRLKFFAGLGAKNF
tara:strand:- start:41 stop:247 length:207 start_codon:yes stop_codon:yes gene_type:complete